MKHRHLSTTLLAAVLLATCPVALAASLTGTLTDQTSGSPVRRVTVRAFAHDRSIANSCMTENDGSYTFPELDPGRYALCITADRFRPLVIADVEVTEDRPTALDLKLRRSISIEGDSWLQAQASFTQSFRATGLGVTLVAVKAFGPQRRVNVRLLDSTGKPIGPPRLTDRVGGEATESVTWAGSELPTIPGRTYSIELSAIDGKTFVPAVAGRGDVYPFGAAAFAGSPRPNSDLGLTICEESDGLRTSYNLTGSARLHRAKSAGQTFIALSKNITFASAHLKSVTASTSYVRFSIHQDNPAGPQIGPSKSVAPSIDAAVAWGPAEVPVTPGRKYYLHIETLDASIFLTACQDDSYAPASAVFDGHATPDRDIHACIAGDISTTDFARLNAHPSQTAVVPLTNPSFEDGQKGWRIIGETGRVVSIDAAVIPKWGRRMFGWTNLQKGENSRTVICQTVKVLKGDNYCFSGSLYTDHTGGRSSDVKARLIVIPADGDDVFDNDKIETSQWYATEGRWTRGSVEFKAQSSTVTIGFDLEQRFNLPSSSLYIDAAHLQHIGDN